jgi:hypothetical protein
MPNAKRIPCQGVLADDLGLVWKDCAPLLIPAMQDGTTIEQVLTAIFAKDAQLWIGSDSNEIQVACVTELIRRGGCLYCNVWLTGGRGVNNWIYFLKTIEAWAKEQGCDAMLIDRGRKGWGRLLPDYKIKTVALMKEI